MTPVLPDPSEGTSQCMDARLKPYPLFLDLALNTRWSLQTFLSSRCRGLTDLSAVLRGHGESLGLIIGSLCVKSPD